MPSSSRGPRLAAALTVAAACVVSLAFSRAEGVVLTSTCFARCNHDDDCRSSSSSDPSGCPFCDAQTRTCRGNPMCRWRCSTPLDCNGTQTPAGECETCVPLGKWSVCLSANHQNCVADYDCTPGAGCLQGQCTAGLPDGSAQCGAPCTMMNSSTACGLWPCNTCVMGRCRAPCGGQCTANSDCAPRCGECQKASPFSYLAGYCGAPPDPTTTPAPTPVPTTPAPTTTTPAPTTTTTTTTSTATPPPTSTTTATGTQPATTTTSPPGTTTATTSTPSTTTTSSPTTTTTTTHPPVPTTTPAPTHGKADHDAKSAPHAADYAAGVGIPVGGAIVLVLVAELLRCAFRRRQGRGTLVIGIDVCSVNASMPSVQLCLMNNRHTTAEYTGVVDGCEPGAMSLENSEGSRLLGGRKSSGLASFVENEAPDVAAAMAIAHAFMQLEIESHGAGKNLAGIGLTVPGVSFEDGARTHGAHENVAAVLSAAVKAKGLLVDRRATDGSLAGVSVYAPSVALAAACAVTYRVHGDRSRRMTLVPTPHLAIHLTPTASICCCFTVYWDRSNVCAVRVLHDAYQLERLDPAQLSEAAVGHWAQRALRPALSKMVEDVVEVGLEGFADTPIAVSGVRVNHPAILDELSSQPRLRVWHPQRHEAVESDGLLAFGAAVLAGSGFPHAQVSVDLPPENELIPSVGRARLVRRAASPTATGGDLNRYPSVSSRLSVIDDDAPFVGSVNSSNRVGRRSVHSDRSGVILSSVGSAGGGNSPLDVHQRATPLVLQHVQEPAAAVAADTTSSPLDSSFSDDGVMTARSRSE